MENVVNLTSFCYYFLNLFHFLLHLKYLITSTSFARKPFCLFSFFFFFFPTNFQLLRVKNIWRLKMFKYFHFLKNIETDCGRTYILSTKKASLFDKRYRLQLVEEQLAQ